MLFKLACGHSRVAIYFRVVPKTLLLTFTCAPDPVANRGRAFLGALAGDVSIFDCRNFDVQIDSIEQRSGDALTIPLHLNGAATAFAF